MDAGEVDPLFRRQQKCRHPLLTTWGCLGKTSESVGQADQPCLLVPLIVED